MKFWRAVLRRLDPWAALLLGVLPALGVVILLSTPGPWQKVVGQPSPVKLSSAPPADVALFAMGAGGECSAVLWLHIDHTDSSLTAVVVAPDTQVFARGAGFAPLRQVADDAGPSVAADGLGRALGIEMDAWVALDREALREALRPMFPSVEGLARLSQYRRSRAAWEGRAGANQWVRQYQALQVGLPRVAFGQIQVVTFSNYVLGFGHVKSDLDLQGATSLATAFQSLVPEGVRVRAAGVIVESSGGGDAWRVDRSVTEQLRLSLELGIEPPASGPNMRQESRPARVLVVLPGSWGDSSAYVAEVRRRLRRSAGAPVAVRAIVAPRWEDLVSDVVAVSQSWRPLAVLVGPPLVSADAADGAAGGDDAKAAVALRDLEEALIALRQPAVASTRLAQASGAEAAAGSAAADVDAMLAEGPLPLSPLASAVAAGESAASPPVAGSLAETPLPEVQQRAAARANVETLVRACWPGALAPGLISTRLGFSFTARRATDVSLVATGETRARLSTRLGVWGYQLAEAGPGDWAPLTPGTSVYYRAGMRRAALVLAGDLGLEIGAVIADDGAPSGLTLVAP